MTNEEALELLKHSIIDNLVGKTDIKRIEAKTNVIEALEKQIPKKPLNIQDHILPETNDYVYSNADCPNCGKVFCFDETFNPLYCSNCGQKIDWSEVTE